MSTLDTLRADIASKEHNRDVLLAAMNAPAQGEQTPSPHYAAALAEINECRAADLADLLDALDHTATTTAPASGTVQIQYGRTVRETVAEYYTATVPAHLLNGVHADDLDEYVREHTDCEEKELHGSELIGTTWEITE